MELKKSPIVTSNMLKFSECIDSVINSDQSAKLNSLWSLNFFDNSMKVFLFKLHNNILGINSRVSHFVRGHPHTCTFCDLDRNPFENTESIKHLFFDCESVEGVLTEFFTWIFGQNEQRFLNRREFFIGFNLECDKKNNVLHVVTAIFKKIHMGL